jgi:hypothetical protein
MTLLELLRLVDQANPEDREELANRLIEQLSDDEKILAQECVGEFIASLDLVEPPDLP